MTILQSEPRLQSEPEISDNYQMLTGKVPSTLQEFIEREKESFKYDFGGRVKKLD